MWNREFHRTERCIGNNKYKGCGAIVIVHKENLIIKDASFYPNGDIDECDCSYGFKCPKCDIITDIYDFYIPDEIKPYLLQEHLNKTKKKTRKK